MLDHEKWMNAALQEAEKAFYAQEIPVGAVVIKDNVIIGRGYNQCESLHDPTAHAEIIAIRSATKRIKDWRLDNHIIFTTIQPCEMCMSAIIEARMQQVFYGSKNTKRRNKTKQIHKKRSDRKIKGVKRIIRFRLNNSRCIQSTQR